MKLYALFLLACSVPAFSADKVNVRIIQRQSSETNYNYVSPGFSNSTATGSVNCYGTNCYGSARSNGYSIPARAGSYAVTGATFSLLLSDGRVAVVNCQSKGWGNRHRRSCRTPMVNDIEAEFSGDSAKLYWTVSLDGKKTESETYKVLAVLNPK